MQYLVRKSWKWTVKLIVQSYTIVNVWAMPSCHDILCFWKTHCWALENDVIIYTSGENSDIKHALLPTMHPRDSSGKCNYDAEVGRAIKSLKPLANEVMCVCVSLVRGTQSSLSLIELRTRVLLPLPHQKLFLGFEQGAIISPDVWMYISVHIILILLCCLWSHGNPPMHNVINVPAMKFLSNWLRIKQIHAEEFYTGGTRQFRKESYYMRRTRCWKI